MNVNPADTPTVGAGFVTVTRSEDAVATSAAGTDAVSWVAETKVVGSAVPFHTTVAPVTKLEPFTVSVKAAAPWVALLGERLVRVGLGVLTEKLTAAEVPPPGAGFTTVTGTTAATARSATGTAAVSLTAE